MRNSNPIVLNHSTEHEVLATNFYSQCFSKGAICNTGDAVVMNSLNEGMDRQGGYLVPDTMEERIIRVLESKNIMRQLATVIHTDNGDRIVPISQSVSAAQWIPENGAFELADIAFSNAVLKRHKLGQMIQVSDAVLKDAGVDVEAFLADAFARSIADAEEEAFITGDGVDRPTGILADGSAQTALTIQNPEALTADDLVALYYALNEAYRKQAVFQMHEDTAKALTLLKDEHGRYLCGDSLCNAVPEKLFGCPVHTSRFMPRLATGAKAIAFGDMSAYWIADRGNRSLRRYNELFAIEDKLGFQMTERVDGRLMIPEAVKVLQVAE